MASEGAKLIEAVEYTNCISTDGLGCPNKCPGYDIKQSDSNAPALKIWRMRSTPSLLFLSGPLRSEVVASDRVISMGQIQQTVCKQMTGVEFDCNIAILETIWQCAKKKKELRLV